MIAEFLKRMFLLGLMLFSAYQLSVAKPAWAITSKADDLDCVCCEAAEQQMAALMQRKASDLVLETNAAERWLIAPGPQQGLGRGDRWFFSFSDPRVSRAPQACKYSALSRSGVIFPLFSLRPGHFKGLWPGEGGPLPVLVLPTVAPARGSPNHNPMK